MPRRRKNIVMFIRDTPTEIRLPDGRVFYVKYKMVDQIALNANIRKRRNCRGSATRGRQHRVRKRAEGAHQIRCRGIKSTATKFLLF